VLVAAHVVEPPTAIATTSPMVSAPQQLWVAHLA
jgi:hypothetical protein